MSHFINRISVYVPNNLRRKGLVLSHFIEEKSQSQSLPSDLLRPVSAWLGSRTKSFRL